MFTLGGVHRRREDIAIALSYFKQAYEIKRMRDGESNLDSLICAEGVTVGRIKDHVIQLTPIPSVRTVCI